jgi:hypothetical protein
MPNCRFDTREQLGEVIAERCVAGCVRERPCLFDLLAEVGKRWSRIGWRLLKEATQGRVTSEGYAEPVKVVARRDFLRFPLLCRGGVRPYIAYGHVEGIGESLKDR